MTSRCTLNVTGMHCASCGLLVDHELEALDGVTRATTDARRGITTGVYDPALVGVDDLLTAVSSAGYSATPAREERP